MRYACCIMQTKRIEPKWMAIPGWVKSRIQQCLEKTMVPTPPVREPCLIEFLNRLWKEPHQPPYLGKQASTALNRDTTRLSRRALEETRQTQLSTNTESMTLKPRHFMCFSAGPRDRSWFILAGLSSQALIFQMLTCFIFLRSPASIYE